MKTNSLIELEAESVSYGSANDEAAFFEWLDKIKCVVGYQGKGRILYITIDRIDVDKETLLDIIALFDRYQVDMRQLRVFDKPEFADWFKDPDFYWYKIIFE